VSSHRPYGEKFPAGDNRCVDEQRIPDGMPEFKTVIHWFRRDLRLTDNTALSAAVAASEQVVPLYVVSDWSGKHRWTGAKRQAFLSGCLESLAGNVSHLGGNMVFRSGDSLKELATLIEETGAEAVFMNEDPDPFGKELKAKLKKFCFRMNVAFRSYQDVVLHNGEEVLTGSGTPYRVFTPYFRRWEGIGKTRIGDKIGRLRTPNGIRSDGCPTLETWELTLDHPLAIDPGERAGRDRMKAAIAERLREYLELRNFPAEDATSRLGADLRWGTISVRELYHRVELARSDVRDKAERDSLGEFQRQLAWRDFFMAILHHYPEVLEFELNPAWRGLEWDDPEKDECLQKWQEGRTGFPIVDAGMRQLVETGFMHNRVRMITAMFLTKDLHLDWRLGEAFFLQHLLDGEIACNNGGWQWSAGIGADAAPYFRIQNPWTQTARYDPDGAYIRKWVPELANVDAKAMAKAPSPGQSVAPGYPAPMVDHGREREETLRRFKVLKEAAMA